MAGLQVAGRLWRRHQLLPNTVSAGADLSQLPRYEQAGSSSLVLKTPPGTGVYFCFTENGAPYVLTVDGKSDILKTAPGGSDDACKATGASTMAFANNLELGGHTATVRITASVQSEFQFMGGQITSAIPGSGLVTVLLRPPVPLSPRCCSFLLQRCREFCEGCRQMGRRHRPGIQVRT